MSQAGGWGVVLGHHTCRLPAEATSSFSKGAGKGSLGGGDPCTAGIIQLSGACQNRDHLHHAELPCPRLGGGRPVQMHLPPVVAGTSDSITARESWKPSGEVHVPIPYSTEQVVQRCCVCPSVLGGQVPQHPPGCGEDRGSLSQGEGWDPKHRPPQTSCGPSLVDRLCNLPL